MDEATPTGLTRADLAPEQALIDAIRIQNAQGDIGEEVDRSWLRDRTNFQLGDTITIYRIGPRDIARGRAAVLTIEVTQAANAPKDAPRFRGHYSGSTEIDLVNASIAVNEINIIVAHGVQGGSMGTLRIQASGEAILIFVKKKTVEDDPVTHTVRGIAPLATAIADDAADELVLDDDADTLRDPD